MSECDNKTPEVSHLYLVRAACPECGEVSSFAEERESEVSLMQDVGVSAEYCPQCGWMPHAAGQEWDVHEETKVERVFP